MFINEDLEPLLYTDRTESAMIEFTRACNFKCTYCAVSQAHWQATKLDLEKIQIEDLILSLKKRNTQTAIIHGHGETTIVKNWDKYARQIKNNGIGLVTCSNLGKNFTEEELDILSDFVGITVSLDTLDPVLFAQLRRGGQLSTVLTNQIAIDQRAREKGNPLRWVWSIVVVDKTIGGLLDLVSEGIDMGVHTFCLCNLTEMPTPEGGTPVRHLSKLSREEAIQCLEILQKVEALCKTHNRVFDPKAGLIETLRQRIEQP